MKLSTEKPPNWEALVKKFGVTWDRTVVTYGDTAYCRRALSDDLIIHESVHVEQQRETSPEVWWEKYMEDPVFRCEQEMEAYRHQYLFLKDKIKDRNALFKHLDRLARDLSSPMYGKVLSYQQALEAIKGEKPLKFI